MTKVAKPFGNENDFEAYLRNFTVEHYQHLDGLKKTIIDAEVGKRDYLDRQIAKAAAAAKLLMAPENTGLLAQALKVRQIPAAREGANAFLPIVRLLFGRWYNPDAGERKLGIQGSVWKPDRSAEKYANVLRYFRDEGVEPDDIPDAITSTKGRLQTIEQVDRQRYAKKDPDLSEVSDAVAELKRSTPLVRFPKSELGDVGDLVRGTIWFQVVDGEVQLMGLLPTTEEAFDATLTRIAKARKKELLGARAARLSEAKAKIRQRAVDAAVEASKTDASVSSAAVA